MILLKPPSPVYSQDAECSGKLGHHQGALAGKPGHAQQTGFGGKRISCVCQKWYHDQQTFPEPQPRIWLCQCTQQLGFCPRAGESGPSACVLWGQAGLLHQKPSSNPETHIGKAIPNSVGFICHCKSHELISGQLYSNMFCTLKNYKTNRNSNHLQLWGIFPFKNSKLQKLTQCSLGKTLPSS